MKVFLYIAALSIIHFVRLRNCVSLMIFFLIKTIEICICCFPNRATMEEIELTKDLTRLPMADQYLQTLCEKLMGARAKLINNAIIQRLGQTKRLLGRTEFFT